MDNIHDWINSVVLIFLAVLFFVQDRTLKYMKTAMDTINPDKIKSAQEIIDKAKEYEVKLKVSEQIPGIVSATAKRFREVNKDFLAQYNELFSIAFSTLKDKDWQDREQFLSYYPKNAEMLRAVLEAYDKGEFPPPEKPDNSGV